MKRSIKTLMPIPDGCIVLTKETTFGDSEWVSQEKNGYDFRLAEYRDGTTITAPLVGATLKSARRMTGYERPDSH